MHPFSEPSHWMAVSLTTDGQIASLSNSAENLIGYSPRELVGLPVTVILEDRSALEVAQIMESALEWGVWEGDIVHQDRSGKPLLARAILAQLAAHRDSCAGFLLLSDLKKRPASAEANSALREVGTYLRQTSHELNNPLAVIMGFTQLVLLDPHCEGNMRKDVERLYAEMSRIVQVVERLHAYALSLQEKHSELEQTGVTE